MLGWLWRMFLWARFLWLISRLNLRLLPAHPDRAAGLRFVGYSVNAQAPFAVAVSVIAAAMIANHLAHDAAALLSYKYVVIGLAVFVVVLVVAPLLAFSGKLLAAWDRGVLDYGALANRVGREFERYWIEYRGDFASNPLHGQLSSAAARMGTLSSNVYAMRFIPVDSRSVILLVRVTLLVAVAQYRTVVHYLWSDHYKVLAGMKSTSKDSVAWQMPILTIAGAVILIGLFAFASVVLRMV